MNPMRALCLCVGLLAISSPVLAQDPATAAVKTQFGMISGVLAKTAEKIPESLYGYKATPEVRSMGQLIGHIADSQFMMCAAAAGEKPPQGGIEKSMTAKADLSMALADSSAYCNRVIEGMNDGNLVTYMRLNKIVPPSSERSGMN